MTALVDTLRYANALKSAGVEPDQAEAMAGALNAEFLDQIATKSDIHGLENRIDAMSERIDAMGDRIKTNQHVTTVGLGILALMLAGFGLNGMLG